jgi:hypothetical protein
MAALQRMYFQFKLGAATGRKCFLPMFCVLAFFASTANAAAPIRPDTFLYCLDAVPRYHQSKTFALDLARMAVFEPANAKITNIDDSRVAITETRSPQYKIEYVINRNSGIITVTDSLEREEPFSSQCYKMRRRF